MNMIYLVLFVIFLFVIIYVLKSFKFGKNIDKKEQIIKKYKKDLDLATSKIQKTKLLKDINQELALNIFFDENELKKTMRELTIYSFK